MRASRADTNGATMPAIQSGASKKFTAENLTDRKRERRAGVVSDVVVANELEERQTVRELPRHVRQRDERRDRDADPKILRAQGAARGPRAPSRSLDRSPRTARHTSLQMPRRRSRRPTRTRAARRTKAARDEIGDRGKRDRFEGRGVEGRGHRGDAGLRGRRPRRATRRASSRRAAARTQR